ncbi:MAG TPA: SIMPL domain-containing protein [Stellaceae bacterium]|nr:SIMPL domain-containing protein [Stellaceae bacterium]
MLLACRPDRRGGGEHRFGREGLLLLGLLLVAPVAALAQTTQPPTVLHLSQTAEQTAVRDVLRVELRIEDTSTDPVAVQAAINRRMSAALNRARRQQGIAVETGTYAVDEEQPQPPQRGPARWRGSQSLILQGKDADAVLKLARALQSGGLLMSSMSYEVSPETVRGAEADLTAEALADLAERAADIADRLHLKVLRYSELRVGNAESGAAPTPRFAAMAMPAPVAAPGEATIRVTVTAALLLGPEPEGAAR